MYSESNTKNELENQETGENSNVDGHEVKETPDILLDNYCEEQNSISNENLIQMFQNESRSCFIERKIYIYTSFKFYLKWKIRKGNEVNLLSVWPR